MAKKLINTGSVSNDNTGDNLRVAGGKLNDNFNEIYNALGDGTTLLSNDIDFSGNKILFANQVDTFDDLSDIDPIQNVGCIIYVDDESSLYYAANGVWRELLTDISDSVNNNYVSPLSTVAYSGNLTDLGIDDGSEGQVLSTNGDRTFSFVDITALQTTLEGQTGAFYLNFENFTNLPSTISGYGITDAFNGDYNSLSNRPNLAAVATTGNYNDLQNLPSVPSDISDLTDINNALKEDLAEFSDNTNLLFSRDYNDLQNTPSIPTDLNELTDSTNIIPVDLSDLTDATNLIPTSGVDFDPVGTDNSTNVSITSTSGLTYLSIDGQEINLGSVDADTDIIGLATVATSGNYNDLINLPTSFTGLSSLGLVTGAVINEFSTDTTLSGVSNTAVPTESAVKTYVDSNLPTDLTDLGISDGNAGQILTTNGSGSFTFQDATSVGNFTLASSTIDTDDSSAINITPSIIANSDLTVENDATVNGLLTVSRLNVTGDIESGGTGTPELFSEGAILLTASTRVEVTQTPFKMASFTTAQRDTLTPENGDTIYNTTTNKFQGYAGGSWVDLH